ncbi:MAG: YjjG family noncanonical pyrimidine nucleotidase [Flavobacteriaceae bacterium]|nr:YjjG family noncanonical pyrimidine nucleotidase [Flavobacteriaceae bacterium]
MKKNKITDVFFDLDHTLWDFEKNSRLTFETIFEELQIQSIIEDFIQAYVPTNFKYWKLFRNDEISKEDLRYYRLKDTFSLFNYPASDELINSISNKYINQLSLQTHLFPGTHELLQYLKTKYRLHIITNGFDEVQYKKISRSGLEDYFSTITTSEDINLKKPNPKVFLHALEKAKTKPEQSVMVGDNLEADVNGALQVGMQAIYFGEEDYEGWKTNQLIEIKNILG